jgi:hypothetical protein
MLPAFQNSPLIDVTLIGNFCGIDGRWLGQ